MATFIDIDLRKRFVQDNAVCLTISRRLLSTMPQLTSDELLRLLHALSKTRYADSEATTAGFPYTFGEFVFGM